MARSKKIPPVGGGVRESYNNFSNAKVQLGTRAAKPHEREFEMGENQAQSRRTSASRIDWESLGWWALVEPAVTSHWSVAKCRARP